MCKLLKRLIIVLILVLAAMALANCGGAARALEGTWTGDGHTVYFNRNGTGTLTIDTVGLAPQLTRVFEWEVADDNLVLEFIGYNERFIFSYDLDGFSPGIVVYMTDGERFRLRRDEGTGETLVGFWTRPNIPGYTREQRLSFRFNPVGDDGFAWGVETDIDGVRRPIRWTTQYNTFTIYYLYEPDATTTSKGEFTVEGEKLTAVINGEYLTFNKVLN